MAERSSGQSSLSEPRPTLSRKPAHDTSPSPPPSPSPSPPPPPPPPRTGLLGGGPVVQGPGPEEPGQCDAGAPGNGDDGVVPDGGAEQQAPQGLDDGRERLVLGEPAHAGRHGGGGYEGAA